MSLIRIVTEKVRQRGRASADDLLPELHGYTRAQVIAAFQNAQARGLVRCVGVAEAISGTRGPGIYVPDDRNVNPRQREQAQRSRGKKRIRVNSVFQLGEMCE